MHKSVFAAALAIGLVACDPTLKPVVNVSTSVGTIGGFAFKVVLPQFVDAVRVGCSFAITAADVTGFSGSYPTIEDAARAFCTSLQTKSVRHGGAINFQGAVIRGRRL